MTSMFSWRSSVSLCPALFCTTRPNKPAASDIWLPTFAFHLVIIIQFFFKGKICIHWNAHFWTAWFLQVNSSVHSQRRALLSPELLRAPYLVLPPCPGGRSSGFYFVSLYPLIEIPVQEKAMAPHSSTLAWKIPWTEEPGRLQSMGSRRVGHDWVTSLSLFALLEKEMATHSSVLAWRIPGTGEPGGLLSMGSHRVGHDWSDLAAAAEIPVKWNLSTPLAQHTCSLWGLSLLLYRQLIPSYCWVVFIPVCDCKTPCLSRLLLRNFWAVFGFGPLWINLL